MRPLPLDFFRQLDSPPPLILPEKVHASISPLASLIVRRSAARAVTNGATDPGPLQRPQASPSTCLTTLNRSPPSPTPPDAAW
jgi:hypothetical protein